MLYGNNRLAATNQAAATTAATGSRNIEPVVTKIAAATGGDKRGTQHSTVTTTA